MSRQPNPFKTWQLVEIGVLLVLFWVQLGLRFTGHLLVSFIVGLPALALLIHVYTWMLPLYRERRRQQREGREQ